MRPRFSLRAGAGRAVPPRGILGVSLGLLLLLGASVDAAPEEDPQGAPVAAQYVWRDAGKEGLGARGLSGLRIHRDDPDVMWAHVHGMGAARSTDGGQTWQPRMAGLSERELPRLRSQVRITHDPRDAQVMYLVVDGQVYKSEDGGEAWASITSGALASLSWDKLGSAHLCWEVRVDPKKSVRLLVGTRSDGKHEGGLFESANGGNRWEDIAGSARPETGLGSDTWLVRLDPKTDKSITVAGRTGVWYSDDRGRAFESADPGGVPVHELNDLSEFVQGSRELFLADARGVWRSKDAGKRWDKTPLRAGAALTVVLDPLNRKRLFAVFHDRGLEVSDDARHARWEPLGGAYGVDPGSATDDGGGYRAAELREVVPHPRKEIIYFTSPATGLHVSRDDGATIVPVEPPEDADPEAVIPTAVPRMHQAAVHPARGGSHLAVDEFGRVYRSIDRGASWTRVGRLGMSATVLVGEPTAGHWLAAGPRLLRSTDDGATWSVLYAPETAGDAIAALERRAEGDAPAALFLLLQHSGLVFVSVDDGVTWTKRPAPPFPSNETVASALAVDAADANHMLVAARTRRPVWSPRDPAGGIFETFDAGKTWTDIAGSLRPAKKDGDSSKHKADWNRGRFILIDARAGLLVYGADGSGIHTRALTDPQAKKGTPAPPWFSVSPPEPATPSIDAYVHTATADGKDSLLVVYLRGRNDETSLYALTGQGLADLHAYEAVEKKPEARPAWTVLPNPGARIRLSSLQADPQLAGRLVATDGEGEHGVLVYEIPGSAPPAASAPGGGDKPPGEGPRDGPPMDGEPAGAKPRTPPEGMRAFSASMDKSVRIWRVDKGEATQTLDGAAGEVRSVVLTPNEKLVLAGGADGNLRLFSATNGEVVATVPMESAVNAIVVDDDSKYAYVAVEEKQQVVQVDLATRERRVFEGHSGGVTALAASEDVNRVYSAGRDQTLRVWDTQQGAEVLEISLGTPAVALAVARDGSRIYAAGGDHTVRAYDAAGEEVARYAAGDAAVHALRLSPDGQSLYAGTDGGVQTLSAAGLEPGLLLKAEDRAVLALAVSVDGAWILAGDLEGGLWLWAAGQASPFWARGKAHESGILGLALTPDETTAIPDGPPVVPPGGDEAPKPPDAPAPPKDGE